MRVTGRIGLMVHIGLMSLMGVMTATASEITVEVTVVNPLKMEREDVPVVIRLDEMLSLKGQANGGKKKDIDEIRSALVKNERGEEVACQLDDLDRDERFDELCFLTTMKGHEKQKFIVTMSDEGEPRSYEPRVYCEMLMRNDKVKEKNRHNNYIESITARGDCANSYNLQHHHGVAFESELNGIRIYFDKRQTLDLYGKFNHRLELKETQFYTQKDQKAQGYGDDVLWVGQTFGLGAFRGWDGTASTMIDPVKSRTQRIVSYGPLRTIVDIEDRGWKAEVEKPAVTMTLRYIQYGGHRDTDVEVMFVSDVSDYRFSTGIINVKGSEELTDHKGLRACWGTDWPSTDTVKWNRETVGLAIALSPENIEREIPGVKTEKQGLDYTYVVKVGGRKMSYKVAYCSANEEKGPKTAQEWFEWAKQWKKEVERPAEVVVKRLR